MKILVVTPYYPPDLGPSAPMLEMLCEDLAAAGNQMTVISTVPHYPDGFVQLGYRRKLWHWGVENHVHVCRVRVPSGNRNRLLHRLLVFLIFQTLAGIASMKVHYEASLITNPAIEAFFPFLIGWIRRKPIIFAVWDIYPDVGIQLGIFRSPLIIRLIRFLEQFCLDRSARVQTLTENMARILRARIPVTTPVDVIPVWLDTDALKQSTRHNAFSRAHSLDDAFVVMYAGNMGFAQGLEHVLEAAYLLRENSSIQFVFIGDGAQRESILARSKQMNLEKTHFFHFQSREILSDVFASADLAIVSQRARVGSSSIPSKVYSWMAAGKPLLTFSEKDSDLFNLIKKEKTGECVAPFDVKEFVNRILELQQEPSRLEQMGSNGRAYVLSNHTRSVACAKFEGLFRRLGTCES